MTSRPQIAVYNLDNSNEVVQGASQTLPGVFTAPIRLDIVQFVHANLSKNRRQAHGVARKAGMMHSAESWGTGRAVARIPRVSGSGTSRAGQAAFGNMCRKGRMFAPLKTWRRWHRKVNLQQKRHAVASALAASALTPLVLARGHRVGQVPQLPLVVEDRLENVEKTKQAVQFLKRFDAYEDVQKVIDSKAVRAGQGKQRNRRYKLRKGPLVIYSNENSNLVKAFRNIPGVETAHVHRLNLNQLAPGGQLGRFIIWSASAFKALDRVFGTANKVGQQKKGYHLQSQVMTNPDLARIINSNEVQSVVRAQRHNARIHDLQKKNPLKNRKFLAKLNPNVKLTQKAGKAANEAGRKKKAPLDASSKKVRKAHKKASKKWMKNVEAQMSQQYQKDVEFAAYIKQEIFGGAGQTEEAAE